MRQWQSPLQKRLMFLILECTWAHLVPVLVSAQVLDLGLSDPTDPENTTRNKTGSIGDPHHDSCQHHSLILTDSVVTVPCAE